jgi:hypothetical protein
MEGKGFPLSELLYMSQLMKKEIGRRYRVLAQKDRPPEGDRSNRMLPQKPARDPRRNPALSEGRGGELRVPGAKLGWQLDRLPRKEARQLRETSHRCPSAEIVILVPSVLTTMVPSLSVLKTLAPMRPSAARTSALG